MGAACFKEKNQIKISKANTCLQMVNSITGGYASKEGKCELMGFKYCTKIDNGEITLDRVLNDIIEYTRVFNMRADKVHDCWLLLHLGLGICFQYRIKGKEKVRNLLLELLPYSRGIDMGLFMRDLIHYQDYFPKEPNIDLEKSLFCLNFCAGFKINLIENGLSDKLFKGPARIVHKDLCDATECRYLDIPIGHPTLLMTDNTSADNHVGTKPLSLSFENVQPEAALMLLRHGASPSGKPFERLLEILGSPATLDEVVNHKTSENPLELLHKCLTYCLRAMKHLQVCTEQETFADLQEKRGQDIYYVRDSVLSYLPYDCYKKPCSLKHACRCNIREMLWQNDCIPSGIEKLPNVTEHLVQYLDLRC